MGALFFFSLATFALQVLLSPTLAAQYADRSLIVILSPPYVVMALVMGFGFRKAATSQRTAPLGRLVGFGALATFAALAGIKLLVEHMTYETENVFGKMLLQGSDKYLLPLVLLTCLPCIFYSLCFTSLVRQGRHALAPIFKVEMLGAGLGVIGAGLCLDHLGWAWSVRGIFLCFVLAAVVAESRSRAEHWATLVLLLGLVAAAPWLEPHTDLRWSARWSVSSPKSIISVRELEKRWNTYAKVQKIEVVTTRGTRRVVSLGNGTGTAKLTHRLDEPAPITIGMTSFLRPEKSAILFCGTGVEIVSMRAQNPAAKQIIGVELNPQVISMALEDEELGLRSVIAPPDIQLEQADARAFLERGTGQFDLILYSWSGATAAFYAGVSVHTAKFAFTKEAFRSAWARLTPEGYLVFFGVSKMNVLATLRAALPQEQAWTQKILLFEPASYKKWNAGWDNYVLYVKKSALSESDLALFDRSVGQGYRLVLSPRGVSDGYQAFHQILTAPDAARALREINASTGVEFVTVTDDRPFPYDVSSPESSGFSLAPYLWATGLVCLLGFILVTRRLRLSTRDRLACSVSFIALGFCGVLWQVYAIYLQLLTVGNPTWALIFGLGVNLLASGTATLVVERFAPPSRWIHALSALGVLCWLVLGLYGTELCRWDSGTGTAALCGGIFIASTLVSLLFPHLLGRRESRGDGPRWFVVDCLAAGFTCGLAPLLIQHHGFAALLTVASCCLVVALGVSHFTRGAVSPRE